VDRYRAMQVVTVPLEDGMFLDREEDVEVAAGTAVRAGLAFAGHAQPIAIRNTRGDGNLQSLVDLAVAFASAILANLLNDLAGAAATGTGTPHGKKPLRENLFAAPVACGTSDAPA